MSKFKIEFYDELFLLAIPESTACFWDFRLAGSVLGFRLGSFRICSVLLRLSAQKNAPSTKKGTRCGK